MSSYFFLAGLNPSLANTVQLAMYKIHCGEEARYEIVWRN
jgi:hypothetical protein